MAVEKRGVSEHWVMGLWKKGMNNIWETDCDEGAGRLDEEDLWMMSFTRTTTPSY